MGGHLVFGDPATQIPVNPKARHPTPVITLSKISEPHFDIVLAHPASENLARGRQPLGFQKSSVPKDTCFVSGAKTINKILQASYIRGKEKPVGPNSPPCRRPLQ